MWLAAVTACGDDAVLSHYSAGGSWCFVTWDARMRGIRVHRSAGLDRKDVRTRDGIRVTSPPRTLLDLAGILPYQALRRAEREAMAQRRVAIRQLVEILARTWTAPWVAQARPNHRRRLHAPRP